MIFTLIYFTIQFTLSSAIILLNGLVLFALLKKRALHTPSNAVLGCLYCSDLLMGLLSLAIWAVNTHKLLGNPVDRDKTILSVFNAYLVFTGLSSIFMMLVNLDRFAAICHPYKYLQYATTRHYKFLFFCTCFGYAIILSITYIVDALCGAYSTRVIFNVIFAATILALICCNWKIFKVIQRHRKQIASVERSICANRTRFQKETRRYGIILLLIIIFMVCKVPRIIYFILLSRVKDKTSLYRLALASDILLLLNSFLNPFVYFFGIKSIRKIFKEEMCCQRPV